MLTYLISFSFWLISNACIAFQSLLLRFHWTFVRTLCLNVSSLDIVNTETALIIRLSTLPFPNIATLKLIVKSIFLTNTSMYLLWREDWVRRKEIRFIRSGFRLHEMLIRKFFNFNLVFLISNESILIVPACY